MITNPRCKRIVGYKWYIAYSDGRIWSEKQKKFLSDRTKSKGYVKVNLYTEEGKVKNVRVHRVIWEAFNGAIPDGYEINHKNCIRHDNRIENLELLTHRENLLYGNGLELRRQCSIRNAKRGGACNFAKPIRLKGVTDCSNYYFNSRVEAASHFDITKKRLKHLLYTMRKKGSNRIRIHG